MAKRTRGFETIKGYDNVVLPVRKTEYSAGYDIAIQQDYLIGAYETVVFSTGLKAYMLADEVLELHIRSSMGIKKGLRLANVTGIIDSDYYNNVDNEGHIMLAVHNDSADIYHLNAGDFIAQGIFVKYLVADNDVSTTKRVGGIGSTGK